MINTQFTIERIDIDGISVIGLFSNISIYENINSPTITGNIILVDSDGNNFIEKNEIEGVESIEFEFKNSLDEVCKFEGVLNGMTNRTINNSRIIYNFDFYSETLRNNEGEFITRRFNNETPEVIAKEMTERIGGQEDTNHFIGTGQPMNFLGTRKRPTKIMEYVLQHGVSNNSNPEATAEKGEREGEMKGTSGFFWWQTLKGYRFCSVDEMSSGSAGVSHTDFRRQLANRNYSIEESMKGIIDYDFSMMGDAQSKLRSGAFKNVHVSFDIDKGEYTEFTYEDDSLLTDKMKELAKKPTRYMFRAFSNERFEQQCQKAEEMSWDKSKLALTQSIVRHNTFNDQMGHIVLPPRYEMNAGDTIDIKIGKVKSEKEGGYDEKHSGRYVITQVGHHFKMDGRSYTKLSINRSTVQQDDSTSTKNKQ